MEEEHRPPTVNKTKLIFTHCHAAYISSIQNEPYMNLTYIESLLFIDILSLITLISKQTKLLHANIFILNPVSCTCLLCSNKAQLPLTNPESKHGDPNRQTIKHTNRRTHQT